MRDELGCDRDRDLLRSFGPDIEADRRAKARPALVGVEALRFEALAEATDLAAAPDHAQVEQRLRDQLFEQLLIDRVVARDDQQVVAFSEATELALDLVRVERLDDLRGPRGRLVERARLAIVTDDDLEAEPVEDRAEALRDVAVAKDDRALELTDTLDERVAFDDRLVRTRIAFARLAHGEHSTVERRH
jgi:hypothetical protein